jgi:sulfopyruvate decarboxylase subunit beta
MIRLQAIESIMKEITNEIVVTSAGKISREVFNTKDRPLNFYNQGAMGATIGIGIGLALSKPNKKVVVIAGDGDVLINLDNLVLLNKLQELYVAKGLDMAMPFIREGNEQKANNIITENKFNLDLYILDNNQYQSTGGQKTCSDAVDFRLLCDCKVIFCKVGDVEVPRISISHEEIKERFMNAIR